MNNSKSLRPLEAVSNKQRINDLVTHGADQTAATELIQRVSKKERAHDLVEVAACDSFTDLIIQMGGKLVPVT